MKFERFLEAPAGRDAASALLARLERSRPGGLISLNCLRCGKPDYGNGTSNQPLSKITVRGFRRRHTGRLEFSQRGMICSSIQA